MNTELTTQLAAAVKRLYAIELTVELTRPDAKFGDYASNVALQLTKQVGKNPREIAGELAGALEAIESVKQVDIAGPGFLNIWLTDSEEAWPRDIDLFHALDPQPVQGDAHRSCVQRNRR